MDVEFEKDKECDAAYVNLTPKGTDRNGIAKRTVTFENDNSSGSINLDFDRQGYVIGIELLGFKFRKDE